MSGQDDDDEEYQSNDCIDCHASMQALDDLHEWPEMGPICYDCLLIRLETAEARVKELEAFAADLHANAAQSPTDSESAYLIRHFGSVAQDLIYRGLLARREARIKELEVALASRIQAGLADGADAETVADGRAAEAEMVRTNATMREQQMSDTPLLSAVENDLIDEVMDLCGSELETYAHIRLRNAVWELKHRAETAEARIKELEKEVHELHEDLEEVLANATMR